MHRILSTGGRPVFEAAGPDQSPPGADIAKNYRTQLLDVNGDGRKDVLFNRMGTVNRSYVGLGTSEGLFNFSSVSQDHPAGDQWAQFEILTGDVNGDSREDVVYVNADASNTVYTGLARGNSQ